MLDLVNEKLSRRAKKKSGEKKSGYRDGTENGCSLKMLPLYYILILRS